MRRGKGESRGRKAVDEVRGGGDSGGEEGDERRREDE